MMVYWRSLLIMGMAALAAYGHAAFAADPPPAPVGAPIVGPRTYTHPARQFSVVIPENAQAEERGPQRHLQVQSRHGYALTVQTGDANPAATLGQMVSKLEAQNLGPGKRWSRKSSERATTIADLPGLESTYEGTNMRVRVAIARGQRTDFVFMFIAPPNLHDDLKGEFERFLANFRPSPSERPATAAGAKRATPPVGEPAAKPPMAATKATATAGSVGPMQRFSDGRFGFSIQYPADWTAVHDSNYAVVFSGRAGSEAYHAMVSVQNVQPPNARTPAEAASAALADLKATLTKTATDLKLEAETPLAHGERGTRLEGYQFLVSYTHAGQRFRKWAVILPRAAGNVAHIWAYTSPEGRFDTFRPIAEAMLDSWTISGG